MARTLSRKLRSFRSIPLRRRFLLAESLLVGAVAIVLIRFVPFRRWPAWLLGRADAGTARAEPVGEIDPVVYDVQWAVWRTGRMFGAKLRCLGQGLCGKLMLSRRGVPNMLVLGVKPGTSSGAPGLAAHAWLCVGELIVLGKKERVGHIPVATYHSGAKRSARRTRANAA